MGCCKSKTEAVQMTPKGPPEEIQVKRLQKYLIRSPPGSLQSSIKVLKLIKDLDQDTLLAFADSQGVQISTEVVNSVLQAENPKRALGLALILSSEQAKQSKAQALNSLIIQQALTKNQVAGLVDQILSVSSETLAGTPPEIHMKQYISKLQSNQKQIKRKLTAELTQGKSFVKKQNLKERLDEEILDSSKLRQALFLAAQESPDTQSEISFEIQTIGREEQKISVPKILTRSAIRACTQVSDSESPFNLPSFLEDIPTRERGSSVNSSQQSSSLKLNRSVLDTMPLKTDTPKKPIKVPGLPIPKRQFRSNQAKPRSARSRGSSRKRTPEPFTIRYNVKVGPTTKELVMDSSEDPVKFGHQFAVKNGFNMKQRDALIKKLKYLKYNPPNRQRVRYLNL